MIALYYKAFLLLHPPAAHLNIRLFQNNGLVDMQLTSWLVTATKGQIMNSFPLWIPPSTHLATRSGTRAPAWLSTLWRSPLLPRPMGTTWQCSPPSSPIEWTRGGDTKDTRSVTTVASGMGWLRWSIQDVHAHKQLQRHPTCTQNCAKAVE